MLFPSPASFLTLPVSSSSLFSGAIVILTPPWACPGRMCRQEVQFSKVKCGLNTLNRRLNEAKTVTFVLCVFYQNRKSRRLMRWLSG